MDSGLQQLLHGDDGHERPFLGSSCDSPAASRRRPARAPATATSTLRRVGDGWKARAMLAGRLTIPRRSRRCLAGESAVTAAEPAPAGLRFGTRAGAARSSPSRWSARACWTVPCRRLETASTSRSSATADCRSCIAALARDGGDPDHAATCRAAARRVADVGRDHARTARVARRALGRATSMTRAGPRTGASSGASSRGQARELQLADTGDLDGAPERRARPPDHGRASSRTSTGRRWSSRGQRAPRRDSRSTRAPQPTRPFATGRWAPTIRSRGRARLRRRPAPGLRRARPHRGVRTRAAFLGHLLGGDPVRRARRGASRRSCADPTPAGRMGGDEFTVALLQADRDAALASCERLTERRTARRSTVVQLRLAHATSAPGARTSPPGRSARTGCSGSRDGATRPEQHRADAGVRVSRARRGRPARSGGSGEATSIRSPVNGCVNASRVACRNCRPSARSVTP